MFEVVLRFRVYHNDAILDCEKVMSLPFIPQIGMGFCVSNKYHEMTVEGVWWTEDGPDTELAVVFHDRINRSSFYTTEDVKDELLLEGWAVNGNSTATV